MKNFSETVEQSIQTAILLAIDKIITPRIELGVTSKKASFALDFANFTANWERGEGIEITAFFKTYPTGTTQLMK